MKKFLPVIKSCPLFSGIGEEELEAMLKCLDAKTRSYPEASYIIERGENVRSIGLMLEGSALLVQDDIWGNRNIVSRIQKGDTFGTAYACSGGTPSNVSITAESDATVMYLSVSRILTVCSRACSHHNRLLKNLMMDTAGKNLRFADKLMHIGQRTTRARIMSYLSSEARRMKSLEFDIPFSRQQLADYLSVERSGLSIELGKLKKEGVIDCRKNHFVINAGNLSEESADLYLSWK